MNSAIKLKGVHSKIVWGGRCVNVPGQNIVTLADNEFVTLAGSNLLLFDNNSIYSRKANILDSHLVDVVQINFMTISKDSKYLALIVKLKQNENNAVNILIFHTSNHMQEFLKPRQIKYSSKVNMRSYDSLQANCVAFSSDSTYLVCALNQISCGIVIFEQFKGSVYQTIATESIPISVSFHPTDDAKIAVTGEDNLIKFWRFTAKSFHVATVSGIKKGSQTYCCHEWIQPYSENVIVVGSTTGQLSIIQNCEQRVSPISMIGETEDNFSASSVPTSAITQLLVRGDHVIVSSRSNLIVLYELRRVMVSKSLAGLSVVLVPLVHYKIVDVESICGLQFCFRDSVTSYVMAATTTESIVVLDIVKDSDLSENLHPEDDDNKVIEWREISAAKPLTAFHSKSIQSVAISNFGKVIMTSSFLDQSIRFWNYDASNIFSHCWLTESFKEKSIEETPFYVDLHPSGLQVICAYETEVKEFAICDNQLDLMRRFGIKSAFQSPTGIPIVISQPVSLVKYSNGGHLLAVVTGKICQLFNLHKCDDNLLNQEAPCRVMTMCDHVSPISDLVFLQDDTEIITSSTDGSVYSWKVGATSRHKEYVQKGVAATHVAVSKKLRQDNLIMVSFESNATHDPSTFVSETVRKRRASSIAVRRVSTAVNFGSSDSFPGSETFGGGKASKTLDFNTAANAITQVLDGKTGLEGTASSGFSLHRQASTGTLTANLGNSANRLYFLAVWTNQLSNNPTIIALDTPVRSICFGRCGQPDTFDFCVLGMADGRIIISTLPIPLMEISYGSIRSFSVTSNSTASTVNSRPTTITPAQKSSRGNRRVAVTLPENTILESVSEMLLNSISTKEAQETTTMVGEDAEEEFNTNTLEHKTAPQQKINESQCKVMRLTVGSVTNVLISPDGDCVIVTGEDGSITILHTSKNKLFLTEQEYGETKDSKAGNLKNNQFLMIEKQKMFHLRQKVVDLDSIIQQSRKEYEKMLHKVLETKDKFLHDLEVKYKLEIQKRDESILSSRNEYLLMKKSMQEEVEILKKQAQDSLASMELAYEKKLAHESTYLEKMKQAYDEYVVHARMDMLQLQQHTETKIKEVENEKLKLIQDIEKEKVAVLKYYDYLQDRNDEVLQSLEEQQTNERLKLKTELQQTFTKLQQAQQQNMTSEVQASRKIQRLKVDVESKEMEIMRVNSDIDWANDRIGKLETSLMQATTELKARSELLDKNEVKIGELQQKIDDMERVRKTLTVQVHNLQSSLQPKEKEVMKMTEKLQELTREYEISLQAITEKEAGLQQKNENLLLLQKQVRELRTTSAQKESALRRAATFFEEFIYEMHQARFEAKKKVPLSLIQQQQQKQPQQSQSHANTNSNSAANVHDAVVENDVAHKDNNNPNGGNTGNHTGASEPKKKDQAKQKDLTATTTSKGRELIAGLNLDYQADAKLKGLQDILKPYIIDVKVEAEIMDDIEAVKQEQERHLQLLHRNFHTLQNSMDTANQAASNKVFNHLMDNQTLLKEVNNLRAEVRALSLENHRLSAQMSFQNSSSRRNTSLLQTIPSFDSSATTSLEREIAHIDTSEPAIATSTAMNNILEMGDESPIQQAHMTFPLRAHKSSSAPSKTNAAIRNANTSQVSNTQINNSQTASPLRSPPPSISSLLGASTTVLPAFPNRHPSKPSTAVGGSNGGGISLHPSSDSLSSEGPSMSSNQSKARSDTKRSVLKVATSQILLTASKSSNKFI